MIAGKLWKREDRCIFYYSDSTKTHCGTGGSREAVTEGLVLCRPNDPSSVVFHIQSSQHDAASSMPEANVASLVCPGWVGWAGRCWCQVQRRSSVVGAVWCCPRDGRRRARENSRAQSRTKYTALASTPVLLLSRTPPGCRRASWVTELAVPLSPSRPL